MIDAQQELDDEILSACHDGELPPTEAEAVRRRLTREPELAERLLAMQRVEEAAVSVFRSIDRRPVPERILDLLQADQDLQREKRSETSNVVHLRQPPPARGSRLYRWPIVVAARIVMAVKRKLSPAGRG
ncbi:MAG TPA: hypothetical protein VHG33_09230 [Woeseiaceae bacterium]|nr:hypothetical protein [Woeseiaceae bacterium]